MNSREKIFKFIVFEECLKSSFLSFFNLTNFNPKLEMKHRSSKITRVYLTKPPNKLLAQLNNLKQSDCLKGIQYYSNTLYSNADDHEKTIIILLSLTTTITQTRKKEQTTT